MAGLTETSQWADEVYQIEQTDPVVGGPPDLAQSQGITNVPHKNLTDRTAWLKTQIDALNTYLENGVEPLVSAASILAKLKTVDGAGSGLSADLLDGLSEATFARSGRTITAGAGLLGGGSLASDRTVFADIADYAEAIAGTLNTKLMTALRTKQAIDVAINALVNGAPGALDTLKELAEELNDNDNAIAALTSQIAGKLNSTVYTAADILTKLKTVDGIGSGLDADTVDGFHQVTFARSARTISAGTGMTGGGSLTANRTISADIADYTEAIAGTSNAKLMTPLRTRHAVAFAIAEIPYGAIGSHIFAARYAGEVVAGTIYSGAYLRPAGINATATIPDNGILAGTQSQLAVGSGALSGTWRALGSATISPTTSYTRATLFVRIT